MVTSRISPAGSKDDTSEREITAIAKARPPAILSTNRPNAKTRSPSASTVIAIANASPPKAKSEKLNNAAVMQTAVSNSFGRRTPATVLSALETTRFVKSAGI